jgi:Cys-tRNA(Pro) deacylase
MLFESLKKHLKKRGVDARFFRFEQHTTTVDAAANRLGMSRERIIKTIIFVDGAGSPVLSIVTGNKRVDKEKLATACRAKKVRKANPVEVKRFTGYDVGAVPPVGHKKPIRTFVDEKVIRFDKVIGGGGEISTLLEISPIGIRRLTNGEVKHISE